MTTKNGFLVTVLTLVISANCGEETNMSDFERAFRGKSASDLSSTQVVPPGPSIGTRGDFVKFLRLETDDQSSVMVNINLRGEYNLPNPLVSPDGHTIGGVAPAAIPAIGSPLVARVRWGVGGSYQVIDFDVPSARSFTVGTAQNRAVDDIGAGVSLCVSGSAFEVQVRNDSNLAPANAAVPSAAQPLGGALVGNGYVKAFISPGTGANVGPIRRTIYLVAPAPNAPLGAGLQVLFNIPSFAKTAWIFRQPGDAAPLAITTTTNNGGTLRSFSLSANNEGPIPLTTDEELMNITNVGAVGINSMVALFDVNPS